MHDTDSVVRRDVVRDTSWMTIREVDSAELARLGVQIKGLRNALVIERNRNVEKIPFVQNYLLNKKNYE